MKEKHLTIFRKCVILIFAGGTRFGLRGRWSNSLNLLVKTIVGKAVFTRLIGRFFVLGGVL